MTKKRRSRKGRGSRSIKSKPGAEQRTEDRSFGSGLDEVGFSPLGRRILVSKPSKGPQPEKHSGTETVASETTGQPASYSDDPLGYDTNDPAGVRKAADDALSGADKDAIKKEVEAALRRWKLR